MANFTPADLAQSATNATSKTDQEILDAAGRVVNGVVILTNDPSVPDSKKGPFLDAIADLFERGAGPTYETLSGQPAARLAIGGSGTPDPVTNPVPTPADAEKNAKVAKFDALIQWIGANGGNVVAGEDIKVTLDRLLTAKVDAAKVAPADMVKKVDVKTKLDAALTPGNSPKSDGGFHKAAFSTDMVISAEKYKEMTDEFKELEKLLS